MRHIDEMMFEICEKLGFKIERRLTVWSQVGVRLRSRHRDHYAPIANFWCRDFVVEAIHKQICGKNRPNSAPEAGE